MLSEVNALKTNVSVEAQKPRQRTISRVMEVATVKCVVSGLADISLCSIGGELCLRLVVEVCIGRLASTKENGRIFQLSNNFTGNKEIVFSILAGAFTLIRSPLGEGISGSLECSILMMLAIHTST